MGYAHILYIHNDGIRDALSPSGPSPKYRQVRDAVGEAVLKVCLKPDRVVTPRGNERVSSASVVNHGSCINHVEEIHSTQEALYIWSGNCLRRISDLDKEDITEAKRLLDEELKRRNAGNLA